MKKVRSRIFTSKCWHFVKWKMNSCFEFFFVHFGSKCYNRSTLKWNKIVNHSSHFLWILCVLRSKWEILLNLNLDYCIFSIWQDQRSTTQAYFVFFFFVLAIVLNEKYQKTFDWSIRIIGSRKNCRRKISRYLHYSIYVIKKKKVNKKQFVC